MSSTSIPHFPHTFNVQDNLDDYKPIPEWAKLERVVVFHRHGDRTQISRKLGPNLPEHPKIHNIWMSKLPDHVIHKLSSIATSMARDEQVFKYYDIYNSYKGDKNRPYGQLTTLGMEQLLELGKVLRERYYGSNNIPNEYWRNKVFCRSTSTHRTQFSLRALISGMKNIHPDEIDDKYLEENQLGVNEQIKIDENTPLFIFPIIYCHNRPDSMHPEFGYGLGGPIANITFIDSIDRRIREELIPNFNDFENRLRTLLGIPPLNSVSHLTVKEVLTCLVAHDITLPREMSFEDEQLVTYYISTLFDLMFSDDNYCREAIGGFFKDIVADIESNRKHSHNSHFDFQSIPKFDENNNNNNNNNNNDNKHNNWSQLPDLQIYSCHDSTLIPLLCCLKSFDGIWCPYASYISMEILRCQRTDKSFARVVYNNKILPIGENLGHMYLDDRDHIPTEDLLTRLRFMSKNAKL